ncbi:hypothetical protein GGS21DRAFT_491466 [Xylaria nigripes]|nr:hypothetical protein GGS21DRAFT_491466 [Xylaria nigripes]
MNTCTFCENHGFSCTLSASEPERCAECIECNMPRCDVWGLTPSQLRQIAARDHQLEVKLEKAKKKAAEAKEKTAKAEANTEIVRLQEKKRECYEEMMKAFYRGDNALAKLEDLEIPDEKGGSENKKQGSGQSPSHSKA